MRTDHSPALHVFTEDLLRRFRVTHEAAFLVGGYVTGTKPETLDTPLLAVKPGIEGKFSGGSEASLIIVVSVFLSAHAGGGAAPWVPGESRGRSGRRRQPRPPEPSHGRDRCFGGTYLTAFGTLYGDKKWKFFSEWWVDCLISPLSVGFYVIPKYIFCWLGLGLGFALLLLLFFYVLYHNVMSHSPLHRPPLPPPFTSGVPRPLRCPRVQHLCHALAAPVAGPLCPLAKS